MTVAVASDGNEERANTTTTKDPETENKTKNSTNKKKKRENDTKDHKEVVATRRFVHWDDIKGYTRRHTHHLPPEDDNVDACRQFNAVITILQSIFVLRSSLSRSLSLLVFHLIK